MDRAQHQREIPLRRIRQRFHLYYDASLALAHRRLEASSNGELDWRFEEVDRLQQELDLRIEALVHHQQSIMAGALNETESTVWAQLRRSTIIAIAAAIFLLLRHAQRSDPLS